MARSPFNTQSNATTVECYKPKTPTNIKCHQTNRMNQTCQNSYNVWQTTTGCLLVSVYKSNHSSRALQRNDCFFQKHQDFVIHSNDRYQYQFLEWRKLKTVDIVMECGKEERRTSSHSDGAYRIMDRERPTPGVALNDKCLGNKSDGPFLFHCITILSLGGIVGQDSYITERIQLVRWSSEHFLLKLITLNSWIGQSTLRLNQQ